MPIAVSCPECGYDYTVKDEAAGRRFECKYCGGVVEIPAHSELRESEPEDEPSEGWTGSGDTEEPREHLQPETPTSLSEPTQEWPFRLGRASLLIGVGVWGLMVLGIALAIALAAWLHIARKGRPPNDAEATMIGLLACGPGCLSIVGAGVGLALGIMGLLEEGSSRQAAIGGVVLNGLVVAVVVIVTVIAMSG